MNNVPFISEEIIQWALYQKLLISIGEKTFEISHIWFIYVPFPTSLPTSFLHILHDAALGTQKKPYGILI